MEVNDKGNGAVKLTKSQRKKIRRRAEKALNAMTGDQTKNTKENKRPTIGEILDPLYLQKLEAANGEGVGLGCGDTHDKVHAEKGSGMGKPASKKSKTQKNADKNPALGCGDTHDKVIAEKCSGAGKPASKKSKTQKNADKNPALGCGDTHDKVIAEKGSGAGKPASKKIKTQKKFNKNPALGCGDTHVKVIAEKGSGAGKVFEATNGEMVATNSAVPDVTMVPEGEQHTEVGNGNTATDNSVSKKRKRQKNENTNSASGDIMKTCEKVIEEKGLGTTKSIEAISSEMVTGKNATPDASMVSKVEEHAEVSNSKTETDNPASKKKRRRGNKNKNPALGDITITCDNMQEKVIAENSLGITKSLEAISSEMVTGKTAIPDASIVSKVEEHAEVANGKTETDNPASKRKRRRGNKKKNPAFGDVTITCDNTQKVIAENSLDITKSIEAINSEMVTGKNAIPDSSMVSKVDEHAEVANGKTATDSPASEKKRRRKSKNENQPLGDVTITCDNTQEKVIAENGPGITKSIEAISSEMVTGKNAIPDLSMVSKVDEHAEVANGRHATDNPASEKKRRRKSKNKNQPLGDVTITCDNTLEKVIAENGLGITKSIEAISSEMVTGKNAIPDVSMVSNVDEHTEVASGKTGPGTAATDTTASKKRKRQKLKNKGLASDGILSTGESTQDTVIVNKVSGTNKPLEALSTESRREDFPELLGGEKGTKTITGDAESTMLKTIECTKVGNSEIGSTGTTTTAQNSPLPKKTPGQRKKQITQAATLGKKLIIFDVNGLLADVVSPRPKDVKADKLIPKRAIFKRPFLNDFLRFCFERFNVAIWSSRTKPVLDPVVDFLLGNWKNKLLFLWDASQCTNSGLRTVEDRHKPVVFKDLRKIWEKKDPENRWEKGTFNESNTLLLDDSPYKALLNPKHSGIFPASYSYKNKDVDDFLGPKGELRTYLEGLAAADNVKSYVEQHPFGQGAMDEKNPHWSHYSRALKSRNR